MPSDRLTRRECLTRGAGAVVATGVAVAGGFLLHDRQGRRGPGQEPGPTVKLKNYFADIELPASDPRISVATGEISQVDRLVRVAVGELAPGAGINRFVARGDVVLIKPNVGFDRPPYLGATTHPEILRALIRLCRAAGAGEILITDNPIETPAACFARSGIQQVADAEHARIVLPTPGRFQTVTLRDRRPDPRQAEAFDCWPVLYGPLAAATKVIGVAPIKDHNLASASMNLKNWYGLLGGRRNQFHQAIHATISDLALMISPTLVIADGTRVMMRNGPTGGRLSDVKPGGDIGRPTIVAAVDPVACDAWCYENLLGRDPARLEYLELAQAKIKVQIASGVHRCGCCDWRAYAGGGRIVTTRL